MKQFNLDEYLKNPSKKVVTRDGRNITRFLCTDARGLFPIVALVENDDCEYAVSYTKDGRFFPNEIDDKNDLFFAPEKHEGWLNLFKDTLGIIYGGCVYTSKDEAKEKEHPTDKESHVATIKIEWEE